MSRFTNHPNDNYAQRQELENAIAREEARTRELRAYERKVGGAERAARSRAMGADTDMPPPGSVSKLSAFLKKTLPNHLRPTNVGNLHGVQWWFLQTAFFDFGVDPTLTINSEVTSSFQVTQEAAFIMMAISWAPESSTTSGLLGPYTIKKISDRQSSRQFNDAPIPLQMIGTRSLPTVLPTPMVIMPNAFVDITMGTWLAAGQSQDTVGSGYHQLLFHGYKTRVEDVDQVLSLVLSR